jgi:UDP-N-acetylglucosamine enolpyruvyl transferase
MGASVTALLVAAQAVGVSTLRGLCPEPEVTGVVAALRAIGLRIEDGGPGVLRVYGAGGPLSGACGWRSRRTASRPRRT